MNKIIQLTTKPFNMAIAFEITGIEVRATDRDPDMPARVNGVLVSETYVEVLYLLTTLCNK